MKPTHASHSVLQLISLVLLLALLAIFVSCQRTAAPAYDIVIKGGEVYDGTGGEPVKADVAIAGDEIVRIGQIEASQARRVIDASGQAVVPGFINMLSWSTESLIADGNSQGEIRQGVTTQIMGEGFSMGPLTPAMKERMIKEQGDIKYAIEWTTLAEYLKYLEKKGVSQNVASFLGATTLAGIRHRTGRQAADAGTDGSHASSGAAGNGGGCSRHWLVVNLCTRLLRQNRGTDRAVQSGSRVSGQIYLARPQ